MPAKPTASRRKPRSDEWIAPEDQPAVQLTDEQRNAQAKALSAFYGAEFGLAFGGADEAPPQQTPPPQPPDDGFLAKLKEAEARDASRVRV